MPWLLVLVLSGTFGCSCRDEPAFTPDDVQRFLAGKAYQLTATAPRGDWIRETTGVLSSACFDVQQGPTRMSLCLYWFSSCAQASRAGRAIERLPWKKGRMHACLVYGQALALVDARLPDKVLAQRLLDTLARFE